MNYLAISQLILINHWTGPNTNDTWEMRILMQNVSEINL